MHADGARQRAHRHNNPHPLPTITYDDEYDDDDNSNSTHLPRDGDEGLLDVDVVLGGGLEELDAEVVGQRLALLRRHHCCVSSEGIYKADSDGRRGRAAGGTAPACTALTRHQAPGPSIYKPLVSEARTALRSHVALVADEDLVDVHVRVLLDLAHPVPDRLEGPGGEGAGGERSSTRVSLFKTPPHPRQIQSPPRTGGPSRRRRGGCPAHPGSRRW
jgi:hypothetical protein